MLIAAHTPPLHHNIVYLCDERVTVDLFMAILYSSISFFLKASLSNQNVVEENMFPEQLCEWEGKIYLQLD